MKNNKIVIINSIFIILFGIVGMYNIIKYNDTTTASFCLIIVELISIDNKLEKMKN